MAAGAGYAGSIFSCVGCVRALASRNVRPERRSIERILRREAFRRQNSDDVNLRLLAASISRTNVRTIYPRRGGPHAAASPRHDRLGISLHLRQEHIRRAATCEQTPSVNRMTSAGDARAEPVVAIGPRHRHAQARRAAPPRFTSSRLADRIVEPVVTAWGPVTAPNDTLLWRARRAREPRWANSLANAS